MRILMHIQERLSNLFHSELFSQLDVKDPLIQLANTINWTVFDDALECALVFAFM
jgi:hypothetical protein